MSDDNERRQYRIRATMGDGTVEVLYASTASPADALTLALATWQYEEAKPVRVVVFAGQSRKPLVEWQGNHG